MGRFDDLDVTAVHGMTVAGHDEPLRGRVSARAPLALDGAGHRRRCLARADHRRAAPGRGREARAVRRHPRSPEATAAENIRRSRLSGSPPPCRSAPAGLAAPAAPPPLPAARVELRLHLWRAGVSSAARPGGSIDEPEPQEVEKGDDRILPDPLAVAGEAHLVGLTLAVAGAGRGRPCRARAPPAPRGRPRRWSRGRRPPRGARKRRRPSLAPRPTTPPAPAER